MHEKNNPHSKTNIIMQDKRRMKEEHNEKKTPTNIEV